MRNTPLISWRTAIGRTWDSPSETWQRMTSVATDASAKTRWARPRDPSDCTLSRSRRWHRKRRRSRAAPTKKDDRARHRQQKGWPPCGPPRTTPTIRKGQRDHLHRVRRGLRGPSRSYVVAKVQEAHTSSDGVRRSWWSSRCSIFSRGPTCPPTCPRRRIKTSVGAGKEPPRRSTPKVGSWTTRRGTREIPRFLLEYIIAYLLRGTRFLRSRDGYVKCGVTWMDRKSCSRMDNWFTIDRHQYNPNGLRISLYVLLAEWSRSSRIGLRDRFTTTRYYIILFLIKWSSRRGSTRWNSWLCSR